MRNFVCILLFCASSSTLLISQNQNAWSQEGIASWYGQEFSGRLTANGERFNPKALTAAHRSLPFGTEIKVSNLVNGRFVYVIINDRGPFKANRIIDLSEAAAQAIGMLGVGTSNVRLEARYPERLESATMDLIPQSGMVIVQIISFSKESSAREMIAKLQAEKLDLALELSTNGYFRVITHPIMETELAITLETLKRLGYSKCLIRRSQ